MKKNFTVIYKAYFTVGVEATSEEEAHGLSYEELIRTAFVEHPRNVVSDNNFEIESITEEGDVLTSEIAETYIASDHGLINLEVFKEIEDAAAESLSKYKGDFGRYGGLNGLTELSDAAAESLAKHRGSLGLDGLTDLSDAAAESLSHKSGDINFMEAEEWAEEFKQMRDNSGSDDDE
jgi:hypothetical protein